MNLGSMTTPWLLSFAEVTGTDAGSAVHQLAQPTTVLRPLQLGQASEQSPTCNCLSLGRDKPPSIMRPHSNANLRFP